MHIKSAAGHRVDSAIKLHELYTDPPPLLADYFSNHDLGLRYS